MPFNRFLCVVAKIAVIIYAHGLLDSHAINLQYTVSKVVMLKYLFLLLLLAAVSFTGWYGFEHYDELASYVTSSQKEGPILTFEAAYTPEELMQRHERELLKDQNHLYGKASVKFLPFLLMDVKYSRADKSTQEAKLIWNLENGEMVLDTQTFDTTHGFEDCINARAMEDDFRILHALHRHGGKATKEALAHELGMDQAVLLDRLEALRKKHLVAIKLDTVRIHLESPLLQVAPQTRVYHYFVTKNVPGDSQIAPRYSKDQVRKIAKAAFGPDFAIRSEHLLFVPIFQISVQNPDGSTLKTYWNGITGKKVELKRFL